MVESVFGWPGIGQLAWQAIQRVDIPIIMGVTMVAAVFIVLGNLLADLVAPSSTRGYGYDETQPCDDLVLHRHLSRGSQATGSSGSASRSRTKRPPTRAPGGIVCRRAVTSVASARHDNNRRCRRQAQRQNRACSASVDCRYDGRQAHLGRDGKRDKNKSWLRWFE